MAELSRPEKEELEWEKFELEAAPEILAAWPTNIRADLETARKSIDKLAPLFYDEFISFYELGLTLWLVNGQTRNLTWANSLKRRLFHYVVRKCGEDGIPALLVTRYYQAGFGEMADHLIGLLSSGANLEFLLLGLPTDARDRVRALDGIKHDRSTRAESNQRMLDWAIEHELLFEYARQRLDIVMAVGLAKKPTQNIYAPGRENTNRLGMTKYLLGKGISLEHIIAAYLRFLDGWMRAASNGQLLVRRFPELLEYVSERANVNPVSLVDQILAKRGLLVSKLGAL